MNMLIQSFTNVDSNFKHASCSLQFQRVIIFRVYHSPNSLTALYTSRKPRGLRNGDNRSPSALLPLHRWVWFMQTALFYCYDKLSFCTLTSKFAVGLRFAILSRSLHRTWWHIPLTKRMVACPTDNRAWCTNMSHTHCLNILTQLHCSRPTLTCNHHLWKKPDWY